jgi:FKBP-type peptidyl-prolyl cis-trans isomerase FklB
MLTFGGYGQRISVTAMKHAIVVVSVLGLSFNHCLAGEAAPGGGDMEAVVLGTQNDEVNYSLGYEVGKDLKRDELQFAPEALLRGIEDALSGARPLVDAPRRRAVIEQIKQHRAQQNLEKSRAFLAANAKKEGVTTLESGVQYTELRAGDGKRPDIGSSVTLKYRGTLIDGTEFDSSERHGEPSTFEVKKLIGGLAEAVQLMPEGAKWEIYVPPERGYGKRSPRHRIPPNSALIFDVELVSVISGEAE